VGKPVLVKASYFPNWQASGAKGPYRVTPNEMVVIPTSRHVRLHYGNTPVDWIGYLLSFLGLLGLALLWRARRVRYPDPPLRMTPADETAGPSPYYGALEQELEPVG